MKTRIRSRLMIPLVASLAVLAINSGFSQTVDSTHASGIRLSTGASSPTTERVRIAQSGNVGVGLTAPGQKLEVSGTISATTAYVGGSSMNIPIPVGVIVPWHKSMTGVPSLPAEWKECNGQTISDAESPMDGQAVPNLNGQVYAGGRGYYLRGGSTSGGFNASSYHESNSAKYQFGTGSGSYYGIGYGSMNNTETGSHDTYSTSDPNLGSPRYQVAAMTMVYIIKIK